MAVSTLAMGLVALVVVQRFAELAVARRNAAALVDAGWREIGGGHYPLIVLTHTAWLVACAHAAFHATTLHWLLVGLFLLLQLGRVWVIASLGRYWTTRILTHPEVPLVRRGPYRWLSHPNYCIVALEIAVLPAALSAWRTAVVFSLVNAALLAVRIRAENRALAARR